MNVTGLGGNTDQDVITITVSQSGSVPQVKRPFGPEGNSVGSYTEKGLLGTHTTKSGLPEKVGKVGKHGDKADKGEPGKVN